MMVMTMMATQVTGNITEESYLSPLRVPRRPKGGEIFPQRTYRSRLSRVQIIKDYAKESRFQRTLKVI